MTKALAFAATLLLFGGCDVYDPNRFEIGEDGQSLNDVLRLDILPAVQSADGVSAVTLTAYIPPNASSTNRTVRFVAEAGRFANGESAVDVVADQDGVARAELRSPLSATDAEVTATITRFRRDTTIQFVRALPERIAVEAGEFALRASYASSTTVTVALDRSIGTPTTGTPVTFSATDTLGVPVGEFRGTTVSDAVGRASAIYTPGPTSYRGVVTIRGRTSGANGPIEASTSVVVADP